MHAKYHSECKHTYSPQDIEDLKTRSKQVSAAKKRIKDAERYLRKKAEKRLFEPDWCHNLRLAFPD